MDDDFEEVHEDDFEALFEFREAIGLEPSAILSTEASTIGGDANSIQTGTVATPRTHASGNMTLHTNASSGSAVTHNSTFLLPLPIIPKQSAMKMKKVILPTTKRVLCA
eukprot:120238_1